MMRKIALIAMIFLGFSLNAQSWQSLDKNEDVEVLYKWKTNKEGKEELRVKLKNNVKSDVVLALKIGFYDTGVLSETSFIADCLQKGFIKNLFREWYIIMPEELDPEKKLSSHEIKVIELKTTQVEWCETES